MSPVIDRLVGIVEPIVIARRRTDVYRSLALSVVATATVVAVVSIVGAAALRTENLAHPSNQAQPSVHVARSNPDTGPTVDDVERVAMRITAFYEHPGYGGVRLDYEAKRIRVLWKHNPPAEVNRLVGLHESGVEVALTQSRYSEPELAKAGNDLLGALQQRYGRERIVAVLPNPDRSGLIVEVVRPWSGDPADIEDTAGYPVALRLVDDPVVPAVR